MTSRSWAARVSAEGRPRAGRDDGLAAAVAEADEPDLSGWAAAGAAGVDLDEQRRVPVGVGFPLGLGAAGGQAVEPGPADGVPHDRVAAAEPDAVMWLGGLRSGT